MLILLRKNPSEKKIWKHKHKTHKNLLTADLYAGKSKKITSWYLVLNPFWMKPLLKFDISLGATLWSQISVSPLLILFSKIFLNLFLFSETLPVNYLYFFKKKARKRVHYIFWNQLYVYFIVSCIIYMLKMSNK